MAEQLSIDRSKAAVLIMDYQLPQFSKFPPERQKEILKTANKVLEKARNLGVPVIYVEVVRGERKPEIAIHPGILPHPGDSVLTKRRVGPFSTTNLDEMCKKQGIDTLVLMGISTSGCVLSALRWGIDIDYKLIVLSDCCHDPDPEIQRLLIGELFPRHSSVMDSGQFFDLLEMGLVKNGT
jgi:nicotinamidase-related amidase